MNDDDNDDNRDNDYNNNVNNNDNKGDNDTYYQAINTQITLYVQMKQF